MLTHIITISDLGEILITCDFDTRQMLLKIYVDLMMDSVILEFKRLLEPLIMYGIPKIFRYNFNWRSQAIWMSFLSKTLLILM